MMDYELMRAELEERRRRAERGAEVRRMLAGSGADPAARRWAAAVRSAVGLGVARFGLRLAGAARAH